MISSFANDPLRQRIRLLRGLIPFAPRGVECALRKLVSRSLLAPLRLEIEALLLKAEKRRPNPPLETACAFPAISRDGEIEGGLFYAVASPTKPLAACDIEGAFPEEEAMRRLLRGIAPASLSLLPNPLLASTPLFPLAGASAGGAFALALEATRRGVGVPPDVVVSAALSPASDGGIELRPVDGISAKVRLLEREHPGCRFFFMPSKEEVLPLSEGIQLIPLDGDYDRFIDLALGKGSAPSRAEIFRWIQEAESSFLDQDYPAAKTLWTRILEALRAASFEGDDPRRWAHRALASLGAIELHGGHTDQAEALFREAEMVRAPLSLLDSDELRLHVAGVHLDRMAPSSAASILVPLAASWRARMAADPHGDDRIRVWLGCLGGLRRLHLLLGRPKEALTAQEELVEASPETERARSLADLGECLRRSGLPSEAREAFDLAEDALDLICLPTYRAQTEAFLAFYQGRLALETGGEVQVERLSRLEASLPERSAARWRLLQLSALAKIRDGDDAGEEELILGWREATSPFGRWQATLGLLRGALLCPSPHRLYRLATRNLMELAPCCREHPLLEAAREAFVTAAKDGGTPSEEARRLESLSSY